jgi:hypothetical protein
VPQAEFEALRRPARGGCRRGADDKGRSAVVVDRGVRAIERGAPGQVVNVPDGDLTGIVGVGACAGRTGALVARFDFTHAEDRREKLFPSVPSWRTVWPPVVTDRALRSTSPKIVIDDCACAPAAVVTSAAIAQTVLFVFMVISG